MPLSVSGSFLVRTASELSPEPCGICARPVPGRRGAGSRRAAGLPEGALATAPSFAPSAFPARLALRNLRTELAAVSRPLGAFGGLTKAVTTQSPQPPMPTARASPAALPRLPGELDVALWPEMPQQVGVGAPRWPVLWRRRGRGRPAASRGARGPGPGWQAAASGGSGLPGLLGAARPRHTSPGLTPGHHRRRSGHRGSPGAHPHPHSTTSARPTSGPKLPGLPLSRCAVVPSREGSLAGSRLGAARAQGRTAGRRGRRSPCSPLRAALRETASTNEGSLSCFPPAGLQHLPPRPRTLGSEGRPWQHGVGGC